MNKFDDISHSAHDKESYTDSLADFQKLVAVRLCASVYELSSLVDEVPWNIQQLLNLVWHNGDCGELGDYDA